ncbi:hypothetical protein VTN00DRAFT_9758 [Thermoascus crustaceus]|uniref:uncharacterized protein n=1 Tax=Thermoascus crustaceus TaxID=5088 RepID=UPI0037423E00
MQEKLLKLGMRSEPVTPDAQIDPLQRAALDDNSSVIADLVKGGADINARFERGWTALHIGSAHNHPNFVDVLLQYGADPDLRLQDSATALHVSATNGNDKVVEVLLRYGARLDAKRDGDGFTALHLAAIRGRNETLRVLIDANVNYDMNIDEPANDGETALHHSQPGIIREGGSGPGGLAAYKIDEVGNVRVKRYHKDESQNTPRDDVLMHHQDPELLARFFTGTLKYYDYSEDKTFNKWAWENRIVTRVIDIKPGNFDDKLEIDIKVVDLDTGPTYEALSYTWKETAYERAVVSSWSREDAETARKMAKFLYAVYCNDESGSERYLQVNCGLRDALKRLRDTSDTKTYWIDQFSINQQDYGERKFQVSGMVWFYNRAQQVTLWVGDEDENTKEYPFESTSDADRTDLNPVNRSVLFASKSYYDIDSLLNFADVCPPARTAAKARASNSSTTRKANGAMAKGSTATPPPSSPRPSPTPATSTPAPAPTTSESRLL